MTKKASTLTLAKTYDKVAADKPVLTVIFIHGIADDSSRWVRPIERLREEHKLDAVRFVTFDLLGSGKSLTDDENLNYDFKDQLEALDNSIEALDIDTPIVLVGHSMGCLISARYASQHKNKIRELILISPPVYTKKDFESPKFEPSMDGFKALMVVKNPIYKDQKAFNNELMQIVSNRTNYDILEKLVEPTTIIYGAADKIIAGYNIPGLLKANSNILAFKTPGAHGIGHEKCDKLVATLKRIVNETL
ncbi:alpha/beta fold hydrolase [Candidatus Saccharibacteria bacterium]|nr:alpha/beta fold hydrolase [Candidatus Saccharibacteria bacterium]